MKVIGYMFAACILLAVLKAAISALLVAGLLVLVWGILFRPAQVFGFIGVCIIAALIRNHPWAFVALLALLIVGGKRNTFDPGH